MSRPTHIREGILDALQELLRDIAHASADAAGSAYSWATTTRPSVKRYSDAAIRSAEYPVIFLAFDRSADSYRGVCGDTNVRDSSASVLIQFWVRSDRGVEAASEMLHDVELVLGRNQTLSGSCRDSQITGSEDVVGPPGQNLVGVLVTLDVVFGRLNTDPATLA